MQGPSSDVVREQLERILGSEAFAGAGRHSRVLRYLVERTLAGEGDQLKEYVLGMEVFDRSETYDPRIDSIVRVEVRRLRARLEDYYRGPGAQDPVIITIPRGGYVPVFSTPALQPVSPAAPAESAAPVTAPVGRTGRSSTFATITAAVAVAIVVIVGTLAVSSSREERAEASSRPAMAVLPFEHYSTRPEDGLTAARITDAVTTELARLGTVSVASRTSAARYAGESRLVTAIALALNVTFVMEASAVQTGDNIRVSVRLVHGVLDRKVWVSDYTFTSGEIPTAAQRIASDAAEAAVAYSRR